MRYLIEIILEQHIGQWVIIDVLHYQVVFNELIASLGFADQRSIVKYI